jgi:hypothetical protein
MKGAFHGCLVIQVGATGIEEEEEEEEEEDDEEEEEREEWEEGRWRRKKCANTWM